MSWCDRTAGAFAPFAKLLMVAAVVAASALSGCNVRPMYGSFSGANTVIEDLEQIEVAAATDRLGQQIRNELVYGFSSTVEPAAPRYRLEMTINRSVGRVGIKQVTGTPTSSVLTVTASFALLDISTGEKLTSGNSFANVSFDYSNQRFANVRAERDAEDRAAVVIAQDIRTRVAAYFSTRK